MTENPDDQGWLAVIGRALAFVALHQAGLREKELATQGMFLEVLGVPRQDAAALLGTTPASLKELYRRVRAKKGRKRGKRKS